MWAFDTFPPVSVLVVLILLLLLSVIVCVSPLIPWGRPLSSSSSSSCWLRQYAGPLCGTPPWVCVWGRHKPISVNSSSRSDHHLFRGIAWESFLFAHRLHSLTGHPLSASSASSLGGSFLLFLPLLFSLVHLFPL